MVPVHKMVVLDQVEIPLSPVEMVEEVVIQEQMMPPEEEVAVELVSLYLIV